jgi:predicted Zn finger-like uncharacterized protein
MKITCPHCDFSGVIQDGLIPEAGSAVSCPKCKKKFFVTPDIPEMEADELMNENASSTASGAGIPNTAPPGNKKKPKPDTVKTLFVAFGLIFGMFLCFIAGRVSVGTNPLEIPANGPVKPAAPAAPVKTAEGPSVTGGLPADLPLIVLPEERFVGAETVTIATVDEKLSAISAMAESEKAAEIKKLAGDLIGKNVSGAYLVTRIEDVLFFFDALLPNTGESRYIEAEADTKSPTHARIFVIVTGKGPEIAAIEKAKKVSVNGFVVSCRVLSGVELGLTNAEVRPIR